MMEICRYDIDGFIEELDIELGDASELFKSYATEMNEEIEAMEAYLSEYEWEKLERVVHNIKGVSANLGINDVYEAAASFDTKLKNNITDSAAASVAYLELRIKDSIEEVNKYFADKGL